MYSLIPTVQKELWHYNFNSLIRGGWLFVDERYPRIPRKLICHEIQWFHSKCQVSFMSTVGCGSHVQAENKFTQLCNIVPYFSGHKPIFLFSDTRASAYTLDRLTVGSKLKKLNRKIQNPMLSWITYIINKDQQYHAGIEFLHCPL